MGFYLKCMYKIPLFSTSILSLGQNKCLYSTESELINQFSCHTLKCDIHALFNNSLPLRLNVKFVQMLMTTANIIKVTN